MAERLRTLMKVSDPQHAAGSPLLLEACALYQDTTSGMCIAQLKWKNLDTRAVRAILIELNGYDAFDQKIDPISYQYENLLATQGTEFGSKTAIQIRNTKIARYDVGLKAVSFANGEIWKAETEAAFVSLPASVNQSLSGDLLAQFKRDLTEQGKAAAAAYQPQTAMGLWQCGCGSWQHEGTPCLKCHVTLDELQKMAGTRRLTQRLQAYKEEQERLRIEAQKKAEEELAAREKAEEERKKREEEDRIRREQERKAAEEHARKKRNKTIAIVTACAIIAAGIGCALNFYFIPQGKYDQALELMQAGNYTEASAIFTELGDYSDAKYRVDQAKANYNYSEDRYEDVYAIYATLPEEYQDHAGDFSSQYADAIAQMDAGNFDMAIAAFTKLGSYSDSAEKISETNYRKAGVLAASGDRESAIAQYQNLDGYSDSASLITQLQADTLFDQGSYAQAWSVYSTLDEEYQTHNSDYAMMYANAQTLTDAGNYYDAIAIYDSLGDYSDSKSLAVKASADRLYDAGDIAGAYDVYATLGETYQTHSADYEAAYASAETARASGNYDDAHNQFIALGNYSDAKDKAVQSTYKYAEQLASQEAYLKASEQYSSILDYEDSRERRYQLGLQAYQSGLLADACAILADDVEYGEAKETLYQIGVNASASQAYEVSIPAFTAVGEYKDSAMSLTMDTYAYGEQLHNTGHFDEAATIFSGMNGFSNSTERAEESAYAAATEALNNGDYQNAVTRFTNLGQYSDSSTMVKEAKYRWAEYYLTTGNYDQAESMFAALGEYSTSSAKLNEARYAIAKGYYDSGDYESAITKYHSISGYKDANTQELASRYALYSGYYDAGSYDDAIAGFELIATQNYSDSVEQAKKSHYAKAQTLGDTDHLAAYNEYLLAGDYSDASQQAKKYAYGFALEYQTANNYSDAIIWFEKAEDYSDAKDQLYRFGTFYFSTQDYDMSVYSFKTLCEYKDVADYLIRIGDYYETQSDFENAYLAYGYACPIDIESEKVAILKATLEQQAADFVSSGNLRKAIELYITLAKIDATEKAKINPLYLVLYFNNSSAVKIGSTVWKYLAYEEGQFIFISESPLTRALYTRARYSPTKAVAVPEWLSSAPNELFNEKEQQCVSLWIMSADEVKKYMPTDADRVTGTSFGNHVWTSSKSLGAYYLCYEASSGAMRDMLRDESYSTQNAVRPGMKLTYNNMVYEMITSDSSRYKFYSKTGQETIFEPLVVDNNIRLPYDYELP